MRYGAFSKHAQDTTDEYLRDIAEKSPTIKMSYDELDEFCWNEKDLIACEERVIDLQQEEAILEYKLDLAKEEGREQGEEQA